MLTIQQNVYDAIIAHAERGLPHEVCGYLAAKAGEVVRHYEMTNTDAAADHFSMKPEEQFRAVKNMRTMGLVLRGVYHSHPETPARPSEEDIRLAYDGAVSYVIISLVGKKPDVRSFLIKEGQVEAEQLEVVGEKSTEKEREPMETNTKADAEKNCRGVGCPMNMVYAKVELAKLNSGQILELILDDGPPINNVPGSVQKEGHTILEKTQLADGAWKVLIQKA